MALTRDQWQAKISKFVPSFYFEDKEQAVCFTTGIFAAIAAVFQQCDQDGDDAVTSTFYADATTPILDLEGNERSVTRNAGESDASYYPRVQQLFGVSQGTNIQAAVNAVLNNGPAFFIENRSYGFFDDAMFCDDTTSRDMHIRKQENFFTIIVPIQTAGNQATIMAAIINAVESNKALGVSYDVLYLSTSDTDTDD